MKPLLQVVATLCWLALSAAISHADAPAAQDGSPTGSRPAWPALQPAGTGAGQYYLGGQAGMFLPIESSVSGEGVSGKLTYHAGLVLALLGGYQFGNGWRAEAELNYRRLSTDRLSTGATAVSVDGDVWSGGFMTNLYYDFRNRTRVTPFVGGGVGLVVAEFGSATSNGTTLWSADRDVSFAYQGMAGFALRVAPRSELDFVYHHYAVPSFHFDTLAAKFRGLNLSAGFRHYF
jgi:opacity protein-like surface antigen